jgi:hypothetical protein
MYPSTPAPSNLPHQYRFGELLVPRLQLHQLPVLTPRPLQNTLLPQRLLPADCQLVPLGQHDLLADPAVDGLDEEVLLALLDLPQRDEDVDAVVDPPPDRLLLLLLQPPFLPLLPLSTRTVKIR